MGTDGVEPSTSSLSEKRSTAELNAQIYAAVAALLRLFSKNLPVK